MQTTLYGIANGESTIAAIEACKTKWTNETSFCVFTISQQTRLNTTFLMIALDKLVEAGLVVCQVVNGEKRYSLPTSEPMLDQLLTLKNVCKTTPIYLKCKDDSAVYRMFGFAVAANQVLVQRTFISENGELMFKPLCTRSPNEIECQAQAPVTIN